jgi:hypothetical protein
MTETTTQENQTMIANKGKSFFILAAIVALVLYSASIKKSL